MKTYLKLTLVYTFTLVLLAAFAYYYGPQIYYHSILPPASTFRPAPDMPPAFLCSLCYPETLGSGSCTERQAFLVTRDLMLRYNLWGTPLEFHKTSYWLTTAVMRNYSEKDLLSVYLMTAPHPLKLTDIADACQMKYHKSCQDLSPEDAVDLEVSLRTADLIGLGSREQLKHKIFDFCLKK